jgi:hypothetical protein
MLNCVLCVQGHSQCSSCICHVAHPNPVQKGVAGHSEGLTAVIAPQSDAQVPDLVACLCILQSTSHQSQLCPGTLALATCFPTVAARSSEQGGREEACTASCSHACAEADGCSACTLACTSPGVPHGESVREGQAMPEGLQDAVLC